MYFRVFLVTLAISAYANGIMLLTNPPCSTMALLADHRFRVHTFGPIGLELSEVDESQVETSLFSTDDWAFATVSRSFFT